MEKIEVRNFLNKNYKSVTEILRRNSYIKLEDNPLNNNLSIQKCK